MSDERQSLGFYEEKGMKRHMLIMSKEHHAKLKTLAKQFKLTQGEVAEVMLDQIDVDGLMPHMEAKRKAKKSGAGVTTKTELVKKMKDLTPEQIAAIEKILAASATTEATCS